MKRYILITVSRILYYIHLHIVFAIYLCIIYIYIESRDNT